MIIHDEIDNYLAADLHNELSGEEQSALHTHLVECGDCRKLHQETKLMNKVLEENLANEKADGAFEQRMLSGFRNRVPQKTGGLIGLITNLMRLRATQFTAVAALLLALVQVGRLITSEPTSHSGYVIDHFASGRSLKDLFTGSKEAKLFGDSNEAVDQAQAQAEVERAIVTGSNIPTADPDSANPVDTYRKDDMSRLEARDSRNLPKKRAALPASAKPAAAPNETAFETKANAEILGGEVLSSPAPLANLKLIRNATVELEIVSFDESVQKITAFASEEHGFVATSNSEKQANGKLRGSVVVKVAPENLDRFLQKLRELGELKNQTLGTEDITKGYFDTEARLKNARVMEQRLIEMVKTKTGKVADLLQVEKELGRVREEIEKMQGELKFWDSQVQFATVSISLTEKDLDAAAGFLLKEHAQLALYTAEVEKIYNDIKALSSPKVQIANAQLNRDNTGRVSASMSLLIAPEESDATIAKVKAMGRVENFQMQTERVAQGGEGMSETAKTKRDKVELNVTISRDEQEQSFQQTNLSIRTSSVDEKTKELRNLVEKQNGRVRSSTFSRDPNGREYANVGLRVPMKNYNALMDSLKALGSIENVSVQRQDNTGGRIDEANAPADLSIHVYTPGNIVSQDSGLFATLRRTIAQSAGAIMWSARMIGVAMAFFAPWIAALVGLVWIVKRIRRARR